MKVLLTGASGFVGSHVLDCLRSREIPTTVLLRANSNRQFIQPHLSSVEARTGSISDPESLDAALRDVTHIIHCAGCVKAARLSDFYTINQVGTRNLVNAISLHKNSVQRMVHVSSLAAAGPGKAEQPARELALPRPVSVYGKSKLASELEVKEHCRCEFVILRPPAVYGPRDTAFLPLFKAVQRHILPKPNPKQCLSLVFVKDLAEAIVQCLQPAVVSGKTYFVASPEVITTKALAEEIAAQMNTWTLSCPLPAVVLWPICLGLDLMTRLTREPNILSLQKFADIRASGWVCDPSLFLGETGYACKTTLKTGIADTLQWYRQERWL